MAVTRDHLSHIRATLQEAHDDIENALKHKDINKLKPTLGLLKECEHEVTKLMSEEHTHSSETHHTRKGAIRRKS